MNLPEFKQFTEFVRKHEDELFSAPHLEITQVNWPLSEEDFKVLSEKLLSDAVRVCNLHNMEILQAYHLWLREQIENL